MEHKDIHAAMVAIMGAVGPIAKDRKNEGQGYKFRGVDDVYQGLQAIMSANGVYTTSRVSDVVRVDRTTKSGGLSIGVSCLVEFTFHHSTGGSVTSQVIGEGMDSGDKASNKAMSVAHKYALLQAFMIPTSEPKDPEEENHDLVDRGAAKRESVLAFLSRYKSNFDPDQIKELSSMLSKAGTVEKDLYAVEDQAKTFL